jgi:hypothetical protein
MLTSLQKIKAHLKCIQTSPEITLSNTNKRGKCSRICLQALEFAYLAQTLYKVNIHRACQSNYSSMRPKLRQRRSVQIVAYTNDRAQDWPFRIFAFAAYSKQRINEQVILAGKFDTHVSFSDSPVSVVLASGQIQTSTMRRRKKVRRLAKMTIKNNK